MESVRKMRWKKKFFRRLVVIWPQVRTPWYYWLENSLIIAIVVSWWQRNQRNHFCIYGLRCGKSQSQRLHPAYLIIDWEINCIDREYRINARRDNWQCDHGVEPMISTALSVQARRRVVWWIGSWNHRKPNRPDSDNASWSYDLDKISIISKENKMHSNTCLDDWTHSLHHNYFGWSNFQFYNP